MSSVAVASLLLLALPQASGPLPSPGAQDALPGPAPKAPPSDVVVFIGDDMNWFDVDNIPTPNLDRLMAAGSAWRRFYTSPVCSPTRYAVHFGRWPRRDGFLYGIDSAFGEPGNPHADEDLESLADLFKGRGYQTGYFGKWHMGVQYYGQNGFADPDLSPLFMGYDTWRAGTWENIQAPGQPAQGYYLWDRLDDGHLTAAVTSYAEQDLADAVNAWWLEKAHPTRKRFGCVAFRLAHAPFDMPPASLLPQGHPTGSMDTRERFECMVIAMDTLLDHMIKFDENDPDGEIDLSTTLVCFLGDNGTPLTASGTQPSNKVKATTFEGGIRCPLVIAGPRFAQGHVDSTAIVSAVDLFATLARWLGRPVPAGTAEDSIPIQTKARQWTMAERVFNGNDDFAIVLGTWKFRRFNGAEELYDLAADPDELTPLDPTDPMYAALMAQIMAIEASLPPRS